MAALDDFARIVVGLNELTQQRDKAIERAEKAEALNATKSFTFSNLSGTTTTIDVETAQRNYGRHLVKIAEMEFLETDCGLQHKRLLDALDRESETTARYDAKLDAKDIELRALLASAEGVGLKQAERIEKLEALCWEYRQTHYDMGYDGEYETDQACHICAKLDELLK